MIYNLRELLPIINEFCSGEVLNRKFTVPCNAIDHLNTYYGPNFEWLNPVAKGYPMKHICCGTKWKDSEIPYIYRQYSKNGDISEEFTLNQTNGFFKTTELHINNIPTDNKLYND